MAASSIQSLGMTAMAASELATLFADKCSDSELLAVEAVLNQYAALDTPLSLQDWCSCFLHEPSLLNSEPQVLEQHIKNLEKVLECYSNELTTVVLRCPALLLQDIQETADKLSLLSCPVGRDLVLQQPHLLTDTSKALKHKMTVYSSLFGGPQHLLQVSAAAPQLFALEADTIQSRHQLLQQFVSAHPSWSQQLAAAAPERLAVWLMDSEARLQRLELASGNQYLRQLDLVEVLESSEGEWNRHLDAAGISTTTQLLPGNGYLHKVTSDAAVTDSIDSSAQDMNRSSSSSNWELPASLDDHHDDTFGVVQPQKQEPESQVIGGSSSSTSSMTVEEHVPSNQVAVAAQQPGPAAAAAVRRGPGVTAVTAAVATPQKKVAAAAAAAASPPKLPQQQQQQPPSRTASVSSSKSASFSPSVSANTNSTAVADVHTQKPTTITSSSSSSSDTERREAFMSLLLSRLPSYAITLLGTDQEDKLHFLCNMATADLSAVLAQPNAEELLEAVYAVHLNKQRQQQQQGVEDADDEDRDKRPLNSSTAASTKTSSMATPQLPGKASKPPTASSSSSATAAATHLSGKPAAAAAAAAAAALKVVNTAVLNSDQPPVFTDRGRSCVFVEGVVCSVCGSRGHLGAHCRTSYCAACNKYGHATGTCAAACKTCGKKHRPGTCTTPRCTYCKLYGHEFQRCPTAHCKRCDYYGHVPSLCPILKEQQVAVHSSSSSPAAAEAAAAKTPSPRLHAAVAGTEVYNNNSNNNSASSSSNSLKAHMNAALHTTRSPSPHAVALTTTRAVAPAPASLLTSPPPPAPLAAAAAAATPSLPVVRDGGRIYQFVRSVVCSRCGKPGHLSGLCDTPHCSLCHMYGHRWGDCHQACQTCGRKHAFTRNGGAPVCLTPRCEHCKLFSHTAEDCPSVVCSSCGYWGHNSSKCPVQQPQPQQAGRFAGSLLNSSQQHSHHGSSPTPAAAAAAAAVAGSSSKHAAAAVVTSPTAAAAANVTGSSSRWLMLHDSGRDYRCHQYPTCTKCGTVGHMASECTTAYCAACGLYGHITGCCIEACLTCGKQHELAPEGCFMPKCPNCQLFGHIGKHCPSAKCQLCGLYGHVKRICPDQLSRDQNDGHTACSSSSRPTAAAISNRENAIDAYHLSDKAGFSSSRAEQRGPATAAAVQSIVSAASRLHTALHSSSSLGENPSVSASVSAAGSSSRESQPRPTAVGSGKQYRFVGPPVCGKCGRTGHVAAVCHAAYCSSCQKWGHETDCCSNFCRRCGKNHARNGCTQAQCDACQLWGHAAKNCPAAQCSICGYWGHVSRICPQQQPEGTITAQAAATEAGQQSSTSNSSRSTGSPALGSAAAAAAAVVAGRVQPPGGLNSSRQLKLLPPAATAEEGKTRSAWLVRALFDSLPEYASALLGDQDRLTCLARLSADDVGYILAQANPQQLLDAVYTSQQLKQKHERQLQQQGHRNRPGDVQRSGTTQERTRGSPNSQDGMDSSNILMQQMVATLAGFGKEPGDKGVCLAGRSRLATYMTPRAPAAEGMLEISEEDDIGHMLGLLGAQRQH